jgi:fluoride ion exporter CrcB/FEX
MGGYMTFWSFSLQTLSGHFGKAVARIASSVSLCLIEVRAGCASAASISGLRSRDSRDAPTMRKKS